LSRGHVEAKGVLTMTLDPFDPQDDCFKPPETPVEVECLHCGRRYMSSLIEWRIETSADGALQGFWCCPTPDCGGCGFGFDILPTDPDYHDEHGGWVSFDDDDEEYEEGEDWYEIEDGQSPRDSLQPPQSGNGHGDPSRPGPHDDDIPF